MTRNALHAHAISLKFHELDQFATKNLFICMILILFVKEVCQNMCS